MLSTCVRPTEVPACQPTAQQHPPNSTSLAELRSPSGPAIVVSVWPHLQQQRKAADQRLVLTGAASAGAHGTFDRLPRQPAPKRPAPARRHVRERSNPPWPRVGAHNREGAHLHPPPSQQAGRDQRSAERARTQAAAEGGGSSGPPYGALRPGRCKHHSTWITSWKRQRQPRRCRVGLVSLLAAISERSTRRRTLGAGATCRSSACTDAAA